MLVAYFKINGDGAKSESIAYEIAPGRFSGHYTISKKNI
jgi:hypothetical protein